MVDHYVKKTEQMPIYCLVSHHMSILYIFRREDYRLVGCDAVAH
jgi:hypothetical protein